MKSLPKFDEKQKIPSVLTYTTMRRLVGILGISLPVVIFFWSFIFSSCHGLLESISAYYHTDMRDLFVGILCAVSLFLFSYHGYDLLDFITFKLTSICCLGVVFFPVFIPISEHECFNPTPNQSSFTNFIHFLSAATFFSLLAFICLHLFTKSYPDANKADFTSEKSIRNRIYIFCGCIIIACVLLIASCLLLPQTSPILKFNPVFWLETIALFCFGTSWLVKGKVALPFFNHNKILK